VQAIDTNLLVRLFVADEPMQAAKVRQLFDQHAQQDGAFWVADIVLVELVWALDRVYGRPREQVTAALQALAGHATVRLESPTAVREALSLYGGTRADFADCLLAAKAGAAGCDKLRTFDKKMKGLPLVALL
jgi:predicted nucleic-acid-binding protein